MALVEFQRAFADLVGDPPLCRRVRAFGGNALAGYELTDLERQRLVAMATHRGMSVYCTLQRANRLTALVRSLPTTCDYLRQELNEVLDEFFATEVDCDLQWLHEGNRFAGFLRSHPRWRLDWELMRMVDEDQEATHRRLAPT